MRNLVAFFGVCCLSALVGCGGGLGTVPVSGKVTVDGEPMEGIIVLFQPDSPDGMPASGRTDANGEFVLTTEVNGDGAIPGTYKVGVSKYEQTGGVDMEGEIDPDDPEQMDAIYQQLDKVGREVEEKALIAQKWTSPATSGLTATVEEGGDATNTFTFEVTSK